ncbi:hypothetical protein QBC37DRAFT_101922 [Rhypophila decipiens]|uniref:Uncharacterized protein n=1 Tax=Rhypophila decipiens TaxID=261697 RepID=A0AAN7B1V5_9PEZI|nr:hypothetical protein QBC37DRAFT_101922 [Rhypophila decipiens]
MSSGIFRTSFLSAMIFHSSALANSPARLNGRELASRAAACGKAGYFACGNDDGGGCCPIGYLCGPTDCFPSNETTIATEPMSTCSGYDGFFACPQSLGDGCCPGGYVCDSVVECRLTLKLSVASTVITVTDVDAGGVPLTTQQYTLSSVIGDGVTAVGRVGLSTPTTNSESSSSSAQRNLSTGQIVGIAWGIVGFLAITGLAGFFILRRRRRLKQKDGKGDGIGTENEAHRKPELEAKGIAWVELQSKTDAAELPVPEVRHELQVAHEVHELDS